MPESPPIIERKRVVDGVRRGVSVGFRGEGFWRCLYKPEKNIRKVYEKGGEWLQGRVRM